METEVKLTVSAKTVPELVTQMRDWADRLSGGVGKTGPATKTAKAPKTDEGEESFDLGDGGEEADQASEEPQTELSEVIDGFKTYAKKKGRDKAAKILAKYKVKSVHDLKPEVYGKVLEDLVV